MQLAQAAASSEFDLLWATVRMVAFVLLTIPLAFWLTRLVGRRSLGAGFGGQHIRVLEARPLGPGRAVCLVDVCGKMLVLGSTPQQVSVLAEIDEPGVLAALREQHQAASPSFAAVLRSAWRGRRS